MRTSNGSPIPLGPSQIPDPSQSKITVNIAVHANLPTLSLLLFSPRQTTTIRNPTSLHDFPAKTGSVFHIRLHDLHPDTSYCLHTSSTPHMLLSDPFAHWIESLSSAFWMRQEGETFRPELPPTESVKAYIQSFPTLAKLSISYPFRPVRISPPKSATDFSWQGDRPPAIPYENLVIYEAHIRALSPEATFTSAIRAIPYLKWLGVSAVQLLPIFEFAEMEKDNEYDLLEQQEPTKRKGNMWGYSPLSFFSPMNRYASHPDGAAVEVKTFVRECHAAEIEVFLDVVYNHTGNAGCPLHFLRVQPDFYMGEGEQDSFQHVNISGCGNTLSPNSPLMTQMIVQSLRWWVSEYHIDGFRLDAAGIFCRDPLSTPMKQPPILDHICADPVLRNVKLIVEGWDAGDAVGSPNMLLGHFPRGDRFCEWNPAWRDATRRFFRGDGAARAFCKAMRGSPDMFCNGKGASQMRPFGAGHGVNFISCHDGFCLADVVSFEKRRNNDGYDEVSFNCGKEGVTDNKAVWAERAKQVRNMVFALAVSRGVPMIHQGDEFGFSKMGNSNTWNDPKFYAAQLPENPRKVRNFEQLVLFVKRMLNLRRELPQLNGLDFHDNVVWLDQHGKPRSSRKRNDGCSRKGGLVAFWNRRTLKGKYIYVGINRTVDDLTVQLPRDRDRKIIWTRDVDTTWTEWGNVSPDKIWSSSLTQIKIWHQSCVLLTGTMD